MGELWLVRVQITAAPPSLTIIHNQVMKIKSVPISGAISILRNYSIAIWRLRWLCSNQVC